MCKLFYLLCDSSRMVDVSVLVIVVVTTSMICWRIVAEEVTYFISYSQCFYRVTLTVAVLLWISCISTVSC